jgi:LytR cell envelope-related transcriptional attenuator
MSGKHEPPTNRSFYLSVGTSTLRFAIIVALVVGGVLLINQAFPVLGSGGTTGIPNGGPGVSPSPSTSPSPSKPPKVTPSPQVVGVRVAVFNGTSVTGLAGDTLATITKKYGMVAAQDPADAPSTVAQTTLYYRSPADEVEAQFLADDFFKGLDVTIARLEPGTNVSKDVQVAIYLGNDYAALKA